LDIGEAVLIAAPAPARHQRGEVTVTPSLCLLERRPRPGRIADRTIDGSRSRPVASAVRPRGSPGSSMAEKKKNRAARSNGPGPRSGNEPQPPPTAEEAAPRSASKGTAPLFFFSAANTPGRSALEGVMRIIDGRVLENSVCPSAQVSRARSRASHSPS